MSIPNSTELALLQSQPQSSAWYLSIFQPQIALQARAGTGVIKGSQSIPYDTVTSGSYLLVEPDFVMLVGSAAGLDDKGRVRVRSITATDISIAENSHINWANDDYLTVLRFVELVPKFTRIISDPSTADSVIFYKDYDIAYTNQNEDMGGFIIMGCHYAGFKENGSCNVYWSASGTSSLISGVTATYDWWFDGATVTGSSSQTPGYLSYTTPGHYLTRLNVAWSNGASGTSYRCVSIYDKPNAGTSVPILSWNSSNISGSRDGGGYETRITVRTPVYNTTIRDGMVVVIFTDDWYGSTRQSIGSNSPHRETIKFVGYIISGTIQYNYQDGFIEFEVGSPTKVIDETEGFAISVESKRNPTTWYELLDMDCRRAIYHYLKWHSTILECCDFEFVGDDQYIQYFDADRTSLYSAINSFMSSTLNGGVVSDRQGKIWAEIDFTSYSTGGTLPVNMSIDKNHWMGTLTVDERQKDDVAFLELGGIAYVPGATTGSSTAYLCGAPGQAPSYHGKVERIEGLALSSQSQLNTLAGNMWAHMNSRYPSIGMTMKGNYSNFDIAPQELVYLTVGVDDTPRGIAFTNKKFAVRSTEYNFVSSKQFGSTVLGLAECVSGFAADTIIIPVAPPEDTQGDEPNPDPPTPPGPPTPPPIVSDLDAVVVTTTDVRTTDELDQASPTWDSEL